MKIDGPILADQSGTILYTGYSWIYCTCTLGPSLSPMSLSPSPTVSPCWAEWWPAGGASGIRPRWTTDFDPRKSHSSGTCRGKTSRGETEKDARWDVHHFRKKHLNVSGSSATVYSIPRTLKFHGMSIYPVNISLFRQTHKPANV